MKNNQNTELYQGMKFYFNKEYIAPARFLSFYEQLNLLASIEVKSILEVGIGNGIFQYLAKQLDKDVKTLDHNEKLQPDFVGSILDPLPLEDDQFDLVAAFEVLEHLPLDYMPGVLSEFARISKKYILLSVPDRNWYFRISMDTNYFSIRKLLSIRRFLKVWPTVDKLNPEKDMHYWHIGDRGVSQKRIKAICTESGLTVEKAFRSHHNPGHHFFLLRCQ